MLEDKELTDAEIIEKGNKAIVKELGVSGYLRYLHLQRPNNDGRDYLQVREEMFKDMSLEEMSKWARQAGNNDNFCSEEVAEYNNDNNK